MNVSEGTVLARAKREGWTQQVQAAKALVPYDVKQSNAITTMQSAATVMAERGERYRQRMAGVTDKVLRPLERCRLTKFLIADQLDRYDRVARRNLTMLVETTIPPRT